MTVITLAQTQAVALALRAHMAELALYRRIELETPRAIAEIFGRPASRRSTAALATVDSAKRIKARKRARGEWYVEPAWAVEGLFDVEEFTGRVLDPACGCGTIPSVCEAWGLDVIGTDRVYRGYGTGGIDFLSDWRRLRRRRVVNLICNPPFSLAEEFLARALLVAQRKVALLLRLSWAEGKRRRWIWDHTPLAAIHPFAHRVPMPPGRLRKKAKGGAVAFAWFVWDHAHKGPPIVRRIERGPHDR